MGISNYTPNSRISQAGVIPNAAARPASPYAGQLVYQLDTNQLLVWNGTTWVSPNSTTSNPPGLELVKSQTVGTGVSSVTVTDAFSSTYDNYRILYSGGVGSTLISLALRIGGSTTGYYGVTNFATFAAGTPSAAADNNASLFNSIGYASTGFSQISLDLLSPNLARWTTVANASWAAGTVAGSTNGTHQVATAFTDFTIFVNTGNITGGTIRVYGYRN